MTKKKGVDWEKVRILAEKGYKVGEIAKKLKIAAGTLYNNKDKWYSTHGEEKEAQEQSGEIIGEVLIKEPERTPVNSSTSAREIIEVKEFYKNTLSAIRGRISNILESEPDEETFKELQILEKLIRIVKEARYIDYTVNDILTYKDLATMEVMVKKLELDSLRALKK